MRKFKVTTSVTTYMWAETREDAQKYQEQLIEQGRITLKRSRTRAFFSRYIGPDFHEVPEDFSKTRNPAEKPRPLDWLEISQDGMSMVALVTRTSKRRVYYYEALTGQQRAVTREAWEKWVQAYGCHPAYEQVLPRFVVEEAIREHEHAGVLNTGTPTPETSIILRVLDNHGYRPNDWEVEHGYWAEREMEKAVGEHIMSLDQSGYTQVFDPENKIVDAFDVSFGDTLPTLDELSM